jgi:hypothetical protein
MHAVSMLYKYRYSVVGYLCCNGTVQYGVGVAYVVLVSSTLNGPEQCCGNYWYQYSYSFLHAT